MQQINENSNNNNNDDDGDDGGDEFQNAQPLKKEDLTYVHIFWQIIKRCPQFGPTQAITVDQLLDRAEMLFVTARHGVFPDSGPIDREIARCGFKNLNSLRDMLCYRQKFREAWEQQQQEQQQEQEEEQKK